MNQAPEQADRHRYWRMVRRRSRSFRRRAASSDHAAVDGQVGQAVRTRILLARNMYKADRGQSRCSLHRLLVERDDLGMADAVVAVHLLYHELTIQAYQDRFRLMPRHRAETLDKSTILGLVVGGDTEEGVNRLDPM